VTSLSVQAEKELLVLRQQHEHLFYLEIEAAQAKHEIIFRPLTLNEAESLSATGGMILPFDLNDWIVDQCVVYPCSKYLQDRAPAALADIIADKIIATSGFSDPENYVTLLNEARKQMQTLQANMESFICAAFPGTKPKDVQNMTIYMQMEMLARAETLLGKQLDISPADSKPGKPGQRLSPEAAAILSQGVADRPDPDKDNSAMGQFFTGPERMDVGP
jgi:hypothetical protein|tara:strand:- start:1162 stop:1818 length:657 start_codon:yes stop_codon:yes gene_type:complete